MRVLVISDTHIPVTAKKLPSIIKEEAEKSDYCLHAGDFISYKIFTMLSDWTKTYGVCGNMDEFQIREKLPLKQIIQLDEIKLGLIHGRGVPSGLLPYIKNEFSQEIKEIDVVVFGHSHYPLDKKIENVVYFNPGSPTDKVFAPYCSYGILDIEGKKCQRRIVRIG